MAAKAEGKYENYYSTLNCNNNSSFDELKQSYQDLIRKHHPDKHNGSEERFLKIQEAWGTLRDKHERQQYNKLQEEKDFDSEDSDGEVIYAKLSKDELSFNDDGLAFYRCRCGYKYSIPEDFIRHQKQKFECGQCSNCILITTDVNCSSHLVYGEDICCSCSKSYL